MQFTVEFYVNARGQSPVQEFLDRLQQSDPDDFAAVMAGLAKLRNASIIAHPCRSRSAKAYLNCVMWVN